MKLNQIDLEKMVETILNSRKYRSLGLNPETIKDLIQSEAAGQSSQKKLLKSVRRKLHNIVAPYLGEPDYRLFAEKLENIQNTNPDSPEIRNFSLEILAQHASTAERIPQLELFYEEIFKVTGKPESIIDLACGLNPFAFPMMDLPNTIQYHAYDIVQPRIDFINTYMQKLGLKALAENRDILVSPPEYPADLGLFLKEAHRFEKRSPGCNRDFWASLNVDTLVVSLPTQNLTGDHGLIKQHRKLVHENLPPNQDISEMIVGNELVFIINKAGK